MAIATRILNDTPKNCRVHISGFFTQNVLDDKPVVVLDTAKLKDSPKNIRLDSLWWLIEEKMGLRLWWKPGYLLLPLESRNSLRLDSPLHSKDFAPPEWDGKILMSCHDVESNTTKIKYFNLGMDMEKSQ